MSHLIKITEKKSPVIVIIRIMFSLLVSPKVITLSRFHCTISIEPICAMHQGTRIRKDQKRCSSYTNTHIHCTLKISGSQRLVAWRPDNLNVNILAALGISFCITGVEVNRSRSFDVWFFNFENRSRSLEVNIIHFEIRIIFKVFRSISYSNSKLIIFKFEVIQIRNYIDSYVTNLILTDATELVLSFN